MAETLIQFDAHSRRSKVRLRVRMPSASEAVHRFGLPDTFGTQTVGSAVALWLGPDQWLLVSDSASPTELAADASSMLATLPHHTVDASSALACVRLQGTRVRDLLAMGSALDWSQVQASQCRRTRFARIAVLAHPTAPDTFDLYFDRSYRSYLESWLAHASSDPLLTTTPCPSSS